MNETMTWLDGSNIFWAERETLYIAPYTQEDLHSHSHHFFELAYVTGGTALHTVEGNSHLVSQGDYFVIDYGTPHSYSGSRDFTLINCLFLPEVIDDTLKGCCSFDGLLRHCLIRYYTPAYRQTPVNRVFTDEDDAVLHLLERMQKEYRHKQVGYQEVLRCHLMELMVHLTRFVVVAREDCPKSAVVLDIIGYVREGYARPITLGDFCRARHFNLQYLSRKFKKETGVTFQQYLQQTRIKQSCRLLAGSDMPIAEVARSVGYGNLKFFTEVFRRLVQMPPREYRRQFRQM